MSPELPHPFLPRYNHWPFRFSSLSAVIRLYHLLLKIGPQLLIAAPRLTEEVGHRASALSRNSSMRFRRIHFINAV
jgi:hypothetical protein